MPFEGRPNPSGHCRPARRACAGNRIADLHHRGGHDGQSRPDVPDPRPPSRVWRLRQLRAAHHAGAVGRAAVPRAEARMTYVREAARLLVVIAVGLVLGAVAVLVAG